jgi:hypothetical protein
MRYQTAPRPVACEMLRKTLRRVPTRCGETKSLEDFAWRRRSKNQRHNYCRACSREYHREHYLANKQRYVDQAAARKQSVRIEQTMKLLEYFREHPCVDCAERDPVVLEFDHLADKEFAIGTAIVRYGWARIEAEMKKCEVVCANCHRRRTARRRGAVRMLLAEAESDQAA